MSWLRDPIRERGDFFLETLFIFLTFGSEKKRLFFVIVFENSSTFMGYFAFESTIGFGAGVRSERTV